MFELFKKWRDERKLRRPAPHRNWLCAAKFEYFAAEAFRNIIESFKENADHPCPDYNLRRAYINCAEDYANDALTGESYLSATVVEGLHFVLDYVRLYRENKPVPLGYFKDYIQAAYEETHSL
jgi:hypothetical protein